MNSSLNLWTPIIDVPTGFCNVFFLCSLGSSISSSASAPPISNYVFFLFLFFLILDSSSGLLPSLLSTFFLSVPLNIFGRPALPLGSFLVSGSALLLELDTPGPRGRVPLGSRQQLRPGGVAGVLQRENFSRSKHGENMEKTSDLAIENLENLENVDLTWNHQSFRGFNHQKWEFKHQKLGFNHDLNSTDDKYRTVWEYVSNYVWKLRHLHGFTINILSIQLCIYIYIIIIYI